MHIIASASPATRAIATCHNQNGNQAKYYKCCYKLFHCFCFFPWKNVIRDTGLCMPYPYLKSGNLPANQVYKFSCFDCIDFIGREPRVLNMANITSLPSGDASVLTIWLKSVGRSLLCGVGSVTTQFNQA